MSVIIVSRKARGDGRLSEVPPSQKRTASWAQAPAFTGRVRSPRINLCLRPRIVNRC